MEILKKLRVSRRFALQGAVGGIGVSLWLPILESMCNDHGTAFAQGEPIPTSFGIFFRGNGYLPSDWTPTGTGSTGDSWQLPTNLESVAGGEQFRGDQRLSPDGNHFIFSSGSEQPPFSGVISPFVFGEGGNPAGIGSVYDNDIATGTVTVLGPRPSRR